VSRSHGAFHPGDLNGPLRRRSRQPVVPCWSMPKAGMDFPPNFQKPRNNVVVLRGGNAQGKRTTGAAFRSRRQNKQSRWWRGTGGAAVHGCWEYRFYRRCRNRNAYTLGKVSGVGGGPGSEGTESQRRGAGRRGRGGKKNGTGRGGGEKRWPGGMTRSRHDGALYSVGNSARSAWSRPARKTGTQSPPPVAGRGGE